MKKSLYMAAASLSLLPATLLADSNADLVTKQACQASPGALGCGTGFTLFGTGGFLTSIIGVMIFAVGAISVVMLVIGGMRYALSGGDSAGIKSAKDTILYALVGLVVSILAFAIVQFIIGKVG